MEGNQPTKNRRIRDPYVDRRSGEDRRTVYDADYWENGWVSAKGDFNHPWAELLQIMQKEAASQGANALIIQEKFTTKIDADANVGRGLQDDRSVTAISVKILE